MGKVNHAFLSDGKLYIEGILDRDTPLPVKTFKVDFNGKELDAHEFSFHASNGEDSFKLPIPFYQELSKKFRQGFAYSFPHLFAKLYGKKIRKQQPLFKMTPLLSDGTEGSSFYGLVNPLLPLPVERDNRKIGGGNFLAISSEFLNLMVQQGNLKKTDHVLDVGCGLGRMAYALAYYLEPTARYGGFDIMPSLISRAKKFISPYFPNFQFQHVNVWNSFYNPQGTEKSSSFRFPYENESFDFVLLTSVFSHMLTPDIRHYLSEIQRVLKPGGRCLFSCFLLTEESKQLIQEKKSTQELIHPYGDNCYVVSLEYPEASIGYEKQAMLDLVKETDFNIHKICLGSWCGRKNFTSYQDIMVISK